MKIVIKKADLLIIALLIAAALLSALFLLPRRGAEVCIYQNGELVGRYPLDKDAVISAGEHNTVTISGGKVYMSHSDCPQGLCVSQGGITAGSIVCLPNRVAVVIEGADGDIDAVAGRA